MQTPRVQGAWGGRAFEVRGAVADVFPTLVTITLFNREVNCATGTLRDGDLAARLTIPSGPAADFFAGREVAVPVQLSGAGGVSTIPAGEVTVRIDPIEPAKQPNVHGQLHVRFATAADKQAPRYEMSGPFEAAICSAQRAEPSMADLDRSRTPVQGSVSGRDKTFSTVLAYVRDDVDGKPIVMLRIYAKNVECHGVERATPFLFGVELGAGPQGDYHAGALMPASWVMQMSNGHGGERSVHADNGASVVQIDSVQPRTGGEVRGSLAAMTIDDRDPSLAFAVSGAFVAKVCGPQQRAW